MFDLEVNDSAGSTLLFQLGGGAHSGNSWVHGELQAELLVDTLSNTTLETIFQHFQRHAPFSFSGKPQQQGSPTHIRGAHPGRPFVSPHHPLHPANARLPGDSKQWLQRCLASAQLQVYYTHIVPQQSRSQIDRDRASLRTQVSTRLQNILVLQGPNPEQSAASQGPSWGFQLWQQHPLEERNPIYQAYTLFKNQTAAGPEQNSAASAELSAEDRQLVLSLGFTPQAITPSMLQQSWETTHHTLNDATLHSRLQQFANTYTAKQPQLAGRTVSRAGLAEFILTLSLASLCEGLKDLSAPGDKGQLLNYYQQVGTPLVEFSEATKKLARLRTLRHNEARSFSDFERESVNPNTAPIAQEFGWVEIKLTYDNHEPIAKQKYIIVDCAGTQHSGVTNEKGMARLTGLPKGSVEISFPEVRGWH